MLKHSTAVCRHGKIVGKMWPHMKFEYWLGVCVVRWSDVGAV